MNTHISAREYAEAILATPGIAGHTTTREVTAIVREYLATPGVFVDPITVVIDAREGCPGRPDTLADWLAYTTTYRAEFHALHILGWMAAE